MASGDFNNFADPKIETKRFKLYVDVSSTSTPAWELQGRGVTSWSQEMNQDVNKETDVLGYVDMDRGVSQPAFTGIDLKLRKESVLAKLIQNAVFTGDYSALNNVDIIQKYEFVEGSASGKCKARKDAGCMIGVNSYGGEAGGYVTANVDFHLSNDITLGEMTITDADPVVFTPDTAAASNDSEEE